MAVSGTSSKSQAPSSRETPNPKPQPGRFGGCLELGAWDLELGASSPVLFRFSQVQTYEFILAAGIKKPIGQGRVGTDLRGENLGASVGLEPGRRGRSANEFAVLGENQQLAGGQADGGRAEGLLLPTD